MAERTGLEPAASNVTGWRSNQLSYRSMSCSVGRTLWGRPFVRNTFFDLRRKYFPEIFSGEGCNGGFQARQILHRMNNEVFIDFRDQAGNDFPGT